MADPVADFLSSPDQFGAPPKRTTLTLPKKGAAATPDNPVDSYLQELDAFKAPVQPTDTIQPEGGGADYLYGGLQGAYNTVRGFVTGAAGQAAGLLDIPVHVAGTAAGLKVPEPEKVEQAVSDVGRATPSTRTGERSAELVEEGLGDILSVPGHVLSAVEGFLRDPDKAPMGTPGKGGVGVMQAQTGIAPVVDHSGPQTEYEKGIVEAVGNGLAMVAGARAPLKAGAAADVPHGTPVEPGLEEPPPSKSDDEFKSIHGESEYTPTASADRRSTGPISDQVREAYGKLTPEQKEEIPVRDQLTGSYSGGMYRHLGFDEKPQVFIDLRDFKKAQEPAGKPQSHAFGDLLLKTLGAKAKELGIPLFRPGGDEFSIMGDREQAMADARRLKDALKGKEVFYTSEDGIDYTSEVSLDYGFGKTRAGAEAAAQLSKKAAKASGQTPGRDTGRVGEPAPAGREAGDKGQAPDRSKVGRLLAGSNASLTPFKAEAPPTDIQWNSVELEPGLGDVRMPQKNVYASPEDEFVQKLGESQYGHSIRGEKFRVDPQVLQRFRQMGQEGHFPWWQDGGKGMIANIAHAVDIAAERRQVRQKAYRTLADEVGTREMLRNAPDYALTFDWRDSEKARPTEIVCGDL